jgi:hypothetical protein
MTDQQQEQCADNIRETMQAYEGELFYTDICKQILDLITSKYEPIKSE